MSQNNQNLLALCQGNAGRSAAGKSPAASALDKNWFAKNPGRSHRVRPALPDEVPGASPHTIWFVAVRQIATGIRLRQPFEFMGSADAAAAWNVAALTDNDAHAVFDVAFEAARRGDDKIVPFATVIAHAAMLGNGGRA